MNKYYLIHRICEPGSSFSYPEFIVENEEVAKHFCEKGQYKDFYYYEEIIIDEKEN